MSAPVIVGLTGPDKVGKSTTARALALILCSARIESFATPLYATVAELVGCTVADMKAHKEEPFEAWLPNCPDGLVGKTPRSLLRWFSTEVIRTQLHVDHWAQRARAAALQSDADFVVFDDARFPNEYRLCDVVVRLERTGVNYSNAHASDKAPPDEFVNVVINIDGMDPASVGRTLAKEVRLYLSKRETVTSLPVLR